MSLQITTDSSSLLYAPTHALLDVTYIGFDSIRERCRQLDLSVGTRLVVRGRADAYVLVERANGDLVAVDAVTARFIQVTGRTDRECCAA